MPKELTTIGVKISYVSGKASDTPPTTGFIHIPGIKATNDYNAQPSVADGTTFDNKEYTTKVKLLKEAPDNMELTVNLSQEFYDSWKALMTAYETASKTNDGVIWFCIDIPGLSESIYFYGEPSPLGVPGMEANSVLETVAYITPMSEPIFAPDPTYAE